MNYEETLQWIATLDTELYDHKVHPYCGPAKRRMTDEELERLMRLVAEHDLPTTLHNLNTSIGMQVYERPLKACYPGIKSEDLRPNAILTLAAANLPLSQAHQMPDRTLWEDGWRVFSKMTHTKENAALCKSCGLHEPREAGYYAY